MKVRKSSRSTVSDGVRALSSGTVRALIAAMQDDQTALHVASSRERTEVVAALLAAGADVGVRGRVSTVGFEGRVVSGWVRTCVALIAYAVRHV